MADQVDLADLGQRRRRVGERVGRKQVAPAGTSHAGRRCVRRPGWLISNSNSVDWLLSINKLTTDEHR